MGIGWVPGPVLGRMWGTRAGVGVPARASVGCPWGRWGSMAVRYLPEPVLGAGHLLGPDLGVCDHQVPARAGVGVPAGCRGGTASVLGGPATGSRDWGVTEGVSVPRGCRGVRPGAGGGSGCRGPVGAPGGAGPPPAPARGIWGAPWAQVSGSRQVRRRVSRGGGGCRCHRRCRGRVTRAGRVAACCRTCRWHRRHLCHRD